MQDLLKVKYHYRLNYKKNSNILVDDYGVIYFNTQKNANSSLKAQFVNILGIPKTKKFPKDIHYEYDFPSATQSELKEKYESFIKFVVLRNPWERLYSCYKNKIEQNSQTGLNYILECNPAFQMGMSFEEFVQVVCEIPDSEADYHFCSQIYLMLYPDGFLPMNYFCNIEKLDFHLKDIKAKTKIPFTSLSHLNGSKKSSYTNVYTPELIEKVSVRYQEDIEFFNYKFGKPNEDFPFGVISKHWKKNIENHPFMNSILKEKNRELVKELEFKNETLMKKLTKLNRELHEHENSLSWKITAPLRSFSKRFLNNSKGNQ